MSCATIIRENCHSRLKRYSSFCRSQVNSVPQIASVWVSQRLKAYPPKQISRRLCKQRKPLPATGVDVPSILVLAARRSRAAGILGDAYDRIRYQTMEAMKQLGLQV